MTDFKHHWEVDANGYPTPRSLRSLGRALRRMDIPDVGRWLVRDFPRLSESIPYSAVSVEVVEEPHGLPYYQIEFSTLGWSGQEALIEVVLKSLYINLFYYYAWRRGGHYTFRVPVNHVKANAESAPDAGE